MLADLILYKQKPSQMCVLLTLLNMSFSSVQQEYDDILHKWEAAK